MDNYKNHKAKESQGKSFITDSATPLINSADQTATPKGLMRIMEIPEPTLYHLKSHLQKYRHGISERSVGNKQDAKPQECQIQLDIIVTEEKDDRPNKNLHIKESIEIQLNVQKKLYKQIEVQRQLQVRIEAQSKYLRSVLMKAQESLSGYTSSNLSMDFLRSDFCGVVSMENRSCLSSSFSELTQQDEREIEQEEGFLGPKIPENREVRHSRSSVDSSLTSSESSEAKTDSNFMGIRKRSNEIQLMEIKPEEGMEQKKRRWSDIVCVEQPIRTRGFGGREGEDLGLSLNNFKDMETCSKSNK